MGTSRNLHKSKMVTRTHLEKQLSSHLPNLCFNFVQSTSSSSTSTSSVSKPKPVVSTTKPSVPDQKPAPPAQPSKASKTFAGKLYVPYHIQSATVTSLALVQVFTNCSEALINHTLGRTRQTVCFRRDCSLKVLFILEYGDTAMLGIEGIPIKRGVQFRGVSLYV